MKWRLLQRIIYPLIPLAIFLFIALPSLNRQIAILGNHKTHATIVGNPVNGKLNSDVLKILKNKEFYLLEDEALYKRLYDAKIKYKYTSAGKNYIDSIRIFDALEIGIPVFYDTTSEKSKSFRLYAYKSFNIPEILVLDNDGNKTELEGLYKTLFLLLIIIGISSLIFRYQTTIYKEKEMVEILHENLYYESIILDSNTSFNVKKEVMMKYITNHHYLKSYLMKVELRLKKKGIHVWGYDQRISTDLNRIIDETLVQERILENVVDEVNKVKAMYNMLMNIKLHRNKS